MSDPASVDVLSGIVTISDFLLRYAVTLAAVAALTMALIEAWKKVRNTLAKFHQRSLLRWIRNEHKKSRAYYFAQSSGVDNRSYNSAKAYEQLLLLTTGLGHGDDGTDNRFKDSEAQESSILGIYHRSVKFALFELEIDRLMGQIQDAADVALNNPDLYLDLFKFLTRSAREEDVAQWRSDVKNPMSMVDNDEKRKEVADRYARLKQIVRRHLDSFQIVTALRWREWAQFSAVVVGAILLLAAQLLAQGQNDDGTLKAWSEFATQFPPFVLVKLVLSSLLGGMLAPVAKDLVDALGKVKTRV